MRSFCCFETSAVGELEVPHHLHAKVVGKGNEVTYLDRPISSQSLSVFNLMLPRRDPIWRQRSEVVERMRHGGRRYDGRGIIERHPGPPSPRRLQALSVPPRAAQVDQGRSLESRHPRNHVATHQGESFVEPLASVVSQTGQVVRASARNYRTAATSTKKDVMLTGRLQPFMSNVQKKPTKSHKATIVRGKLQLKAPTRSSASSTTATVRCRRSRGPYWSHTASSLAKIRSKVTPHDDASRVLLHDAPIEMSGKRHAPVEEAEPFKLMPQEIQIIRESPEPIVTETPSAVRVN